MAYEILDCTLRDGGYYTNWDFDDDLVATYVSNLSKLPISAVEIGYCSHPTPGYRGEWAYLGLDRLTDIKRQLRPDQQLGVMLDAKDCSPERIPELVGHLVGVVDLIRMAVAPAQFNHGLALARELKKLGFRVGFNTMYLSTYTEDLSVLAPLVAGADAIDMLALVDSYGGCTPTQVAGHIRKARAKFPNTPVGFHGHDNTCMGYANAMAAVEAGAAVIDATFVGMGRGAGNTRTEMLLVERSSAGVDVDLDAVTHIVDEFEGLKTIYGWGTNLPYMLSGAANLPQKDVMDWLGKNRYSPVSVVRALQNQSSAAVDGREFPDLRPNVFSSEENRTVLIVGGGTGVRRHLRAIRDFARRSGYVVIHASTRHLDLINDLGPNQLVCLPGHAATRLPDEVNMENVAGFVTPLAPRFPGTVPENLTRPVFQAAPYPPVEGEALGPVSDIGPLALALGAARALSAQRIYLVGFDGYEKATLAEQELSAEVQATLDRVQEEGGIEVFSLTPTVYALPSRSIYAEALGA